MPQYIVKRRWQHWRFYVAGSALGLLSGCVDRFTPDVITTTQNYLVVDGFINMRGVTTVQLTRTRNLSAGTTAPVEAKASVTIQDETGARYPLTEQAAGTYTSAALTLSPNHQYQLRLRTAAGRQYASDLVPGKLAPAIDNVTWASEPSGVQIYVDTHDAANATRYYRWTYQETWQFRSASQSTLEYVNGAMRPRTNNIYQCWQSEIPSDINQSSTDKLSQDVVAKFPLRRLVPTSVKLGIKYSILVQQHAQTLEEYAYWDQLKKNTESLGTLFDPLPSQISGNVHCLDDASERVLGYVGASSVSEFRLFIDRSQFPLTNRFATGYETCVPDTIVLADAPRVFNNTSYLPVYPLFDRTGMIIAYIGGSAECIDCRRHGTNVKPSFWP